MNRGVEDMFFSSMDFILVVLHILKQSAPVWSYILLFHFYREVFNWVSTVILRLPWFCFTTFCDWLAWGNKGKDRAAFATRWKSNPSQSSHVFSRPWRWFSASNSDWFIALFTSVCVLVLRDSVQNRSIWSVNMYIERGFVTFSTACLPLRLIRRAGKETGWDLVGRTVNYGPQNWPITPRVPTITERYRNKISYWTKKVDWTEEVFVVFTDL